MGNSFTLPFSSITFLLLYPGHFFSPLGANVEDPFKKSSCAFKRVCHTSNGVLWNAAQNIHKIELFFPVTWPDFLCHHTSPTWFSIKSQNIWVSIVDSVKPSFDIIALQSHSHRWIHTWTLNTHTHTHRNSLLPVLDWASLLCHTIFSCETISTGPSSGFKYFLIVEPITKLAISPCFCYLIIFQEELRRAKKL